MAYVQTRPRIPPRKWARRVAIGYQKPTASVRLRARAPSLRREYPGRCDDCAADLKKKKVVNTGDVRPNQEKKYSPRAERPVVPIHRVGKFARFCTRQRIAHVAIWVERKTANKRCQLESNPM
jgi:hypothetical protein